MAWPCLHYKALWASRTGGPPPNLHGQWGLAQAESCLYSEIVWESTMRLSRKGCQGALWHCNSIDDGISMPGNLLLGSRVANESCRQKLLLEKAGAPGSDPGRHKQDNNSTNLGLAVVRSGMSKSKMSGLSGLSSPSTSRAPLTLAAVAQLIWKINFPASW